MNTPQKTIKPKTATIVLRTFVVVLGAVAVTMFAAYGYRTVFQKVYDYSSERQKYASLDRCDEQQCLFKGFEYKDGKRFDVVVGYGQIRGYYATTTIINKNIINPDNELFTCDTLIITGGTSDLTKRITITDEQGRLLTYISLDKLSSTDRDSIKNTTINNQVGLKVTRNIPQPGWGSGCPRFLDIIGIEKPERF